MKPAIAQALAANFGIKDPKVLSVIGKLAGAPLRVCEVVDAEDKLYICLQVGEVDHVTVKVEGLDSALRNAAFQTGVKK